jgi:hypothetical protein
MGEDGDRARLDVRGAPGAGAFVMDEFLLLVRYRFLLYTVWGLADTAPPGRRAGAGAMNIDEDR